MQMKACLTSLLDTAETDNVQQMKLGLENFQLL